MRLFQVYAAGNFVEAGIDLRPQAAREFFEILARRGRLEAERDDAEAQSEFLGAHRLKPAIVLDVPLLFEKGGWRRCHITVVVSAPYRVQRARVLARPGMTPQKFAGILKGQMPDREKRALADVVIETGRGRRETWLEVKQLVDGL